VAVTMRAARIASEVWPRRPENMLRPPLAAGRSGKLALYYTIWMEVPQGYKP
jgi:hypothetical protein